MSRIDYVVIGRNVRKARERRNLTQEKFAELAGTAPEYVGTIERARKRLSLETAVKVAYALGMSVDDLLEGAVDEWQDA